MMDAEKLLARLDRAIAGRVEKAQGRISRGQEDAMARAAKVPTSRGSGYRRRIRAPRSLAGLDVNSKRFTPGMFYARFNERGDVEPVPSDENLVSRVPELRLNDAGEYERVIGPDGRPKLVPLTYNNDMLWDVFSPDGPMPIPYELEMRDVLNPDGTPKMGEDGKPLKKPVRGNDGRWLLAKGPDGNPIKLKKKWDERAKRMVQQYQRNPNASKVPYNSSGLVKDALRIRERMLNGMTYQEALMADRRALENEDIDRGHRRWLRNIAHIIADLDEASRADGGTGVLDKEAIGWLDKRPETEKGVPRFLMDEYFRNPSMMTGVSGRKTQEGDWWDPEKAEAIPAFKEDTPLDDYRILQLMNRLNETANHDRDQKKVENRRQAIRDKAADAYDSSTAEVYTQTEKEELAAIDMQLKGMAVLMKDKALPKETRDVYRDAVKQLRAKKAAIYDTASKRPQTAYDEARAKVKEEKAIAGIRNADAEAAAIPDAYEGLTFGEGMDMLDRLRTNHEKTWGQLDDEDAYDVMLLLSYLPKEARDRLVKEGVVGLRRPPERTIRGNYGGRDSLRAQLIRESWDTRMQAAKEFNKDDSHGALSDRLMAALGKNPDGTDVQTTADPAVKQEAEAWLEENGYDTPKDRDEAAVYLLDYRGKKEREQKKRDEFRFDQETAGSVKAARQAIMESIIEDFSDRGWDVPDKKALDDKLTAFFKGYANVGRNGKDELKRWLTNQGISQKEARRLIEAYSFLRSTDIENPAGSKGEQSKVRSLNMKALNLDPSGMFGKDDTDVSEALRRMYKEKREEYMNEDDDSILYQEYRKDLIGTLPKKLRLLNDLSKNIDPWGKSILSYRNHLVGLSGGYTGRDSTRYLEEHPDSMLYSKMLTTLDGMMHARARANWLIRNGDTAGAVTIMDDARKNANKGYRGYATFGSQAEGVSVPGTTVDLFREMARTPEEGESEAVGLTPIPVSDRKNIDLRNGTPSQPDQVKVTPYVAPTVPTIRPGAEQEVEVLSPAEEEAKKKAEEEAKTPKPAPAPTDHIGAESTTGVFTGKGPNIFPEADKLKENRKKLSEGSASAEEESGKGPKTASANGEGLNTPDTIAKDMDDDMDFADMSIGEMMSYIEKKGGKDGHPYGLPVQGSVFAYGSIRNTMGHGKDPSFQGVKTADSKVDGLTVKRVDVGRVEPSDTGSA